MHLVSCARPEEPLETAPRTALLADLTEGERWDGFWSSTTDNYYIRCTRDSGAVEWFELEDDVSPPDADGDVKVLALRSKSVRRSRVTVVVAQSPTGRRMLVGNARRTTR